MLRLREGNGAFRPMGLYGDFPDDIRQSGFNNKPVMLSIQMRG